MTIVAPSRKKSSVVAANKTIVFSLILSSALCISRLSLISKDFKDIGYIDKQLYVAYPDIESVNLPGLGIESIPQGMVKSNSIRSISLPDNKITEVKKHIFDETPNLEYLNLAGNSISIDDFQIGHENLKVLIFDFQNSTKISDPNLLIKELKIRLPNVEVLSWKGLNHEFLLSWMKVFPKLTTVYVSDSNYIQMVNTSAIAENAYNLKHFHLERNLIDEFVMDVPGNIEELYLDENPLKYFWINPNYQSLKILSLSNCLLSEIPVIYSLQVLDISHNEIRLVTFDTLQHMPLLKYLNLNNNQLTTLPEVHHLNKLETLSLGDNLIGNITDIFMSNSLKMLNLRGNNIDNIDVIGWWQVNMLEYLDLSRNKLTSLPSMWHNSMPMLKYLNLEFNNFIHNFVDLRELYIKNNNITHINIDQNILQLVPRKCTVYMDSSRSVEIFRFSAFQVFGIILVPENSLSVQRQGLRDSEKKQMDANGSQISESAKLVIRAEANRRPPDTLLVVSFAKMLFARLRVVLFLFVVPLLSASHAPPIFVGMRRSHGVRYYPTENPATEASREVDIVGNPAQYCVANSVLNFTGMGLQRIGDFFVNTTYARELYLDENKITEISETAFDSMKGLAILSMSGNKLRTDKLLWFHYHETLWRLTIENNVDTSMNGQPHIRDILEQLPRLEYLSLRRNNIALVEIQFDKFAPILNWLDLSGNKLESYDFLVYLPRTMRNLYLQDNDCLCTISKLPSDIEHLQVSGNRIVELCNENCSYASLSLKGLKKLRTLTASRNNIRVVSEDAFKDVSQIERLDLSWNQLSFYPKSRSLNHLKYLDLSHNQINEVMNLCDSTLTSVETLNLSDNHISMISNNFVNMMYLRTLDLSNNRIAILPTMLIFNSRSLEVLLLRNNSIEDIDDLFKKNSFRELELHLEDNPFSVVEYYNFQIHLKEPVTRSELPDKSSIESFGDTNDVSDIEGDVDDTDGISHS
ncbi:Insulin-like growth factor-binding protein complex acid labile subunit [Melipona quadrifasciata]|uniref:Insulin-like growth factor-binding protein complex acid labile subunit n=1 Tax=Melipona quadrifasciata TaxID=166423 RepID=A0A0M8ZTV0_9HYME|nr:Insulin-like growth factor-binding protein complex acid labile subunit [Melipona quadrifasciata]